MSIFGIAADLGIDHKKIPPDAKVSKEKLLQCFMQLSHLKSDEKILFDLMAPHCDVVAFKRYQDVMYKDYIGEHIFHI